MPLKNVSNILARILSTFLFALFLWAASRCNAYKNTEKERDSTREELTKAAYECCNLHNQLRDTENELYYANERLQDVDNGMDDERKKFRNKIQDLNGQHLVDQEEIRSLKQHVSNIECDHDEYGRRLGYASREKRKVALENQGLVHANQKLKQEKQQLEVSLTEKDEMISDLQAHRIDKIPEPIATVSSPPIYTQSNDEIRMHHQMHRPIKTNFTLGGTVLEQPASDGGLAKRNERIQDLEQQNRTLKSDVEVLRADLEDLREEHGECNGHLQTQLAKKDEEMRAFQTEKKRADKESAETVASLHAELEKKEQEVEKAKRELVATQEASADKGQRLNTLSSELEVSRHNHAQCDENSASQSSKIGELTTAKEQLEDTIRVKNDEIATVHRQVSDMGKLRDEIGLLQGSNGNLSQRLVAADNERSSLIREGQGLVEQIRTLTDLQTRSQTETLSVQARIKTLSRTGEHQLQNIKSLETRCQNLRAALDAAVEDVEMPDEKSRDEIRREIAQELRSRVPDDLRRQLRGEVERQLRQEFQNHYSNQLAGNSKRIQEQERRIVEQNARLEKIDANSTVNHTACEKKEANLESTITKLRQDAKIFQGNFARLTSDVKNVREQLSRTETANADLKRDLETSKADQRRAQNVNPLQSKLVACQRDVEKMKVDRDKARDNAGVYSKKLSELKKEHDALQNEHRALKEKSPLDGGSTSGLRPARLPTRQPANTPVLGGGAGKKREHDEYSDGKADDKGVDEGKKIKTYHLQALRDRF